MSARTLVQGFVFAFALCAIAPVALSQAPATATPKAPTPASAPAMVPQKPPAAPAPSHVAPPAPPHVAPVAGTPPAAATEPKPLSIDTTHSRIGFVASTLLFDVDGKFEKYEVLLEGEPSALPKAKVKVSIDAASIDTDNDKRDEHLRSPDFFDAKQFPKLTFTSTKIAQQGDNVVVTGVLAMHGKEKTISIKFKRAHGKNGAGLDATTLRGKLPIKRSDFGIGSDSIAAKISLEDEVVLDLLVVALI